MNKHLKLLGTQGFSLCVIALAALFIFTFVSCDNDTTSSKDPLTGDVFLDGYEEDEDENLFVMVGGQLIAVTEDEAEDEVYLGGSGKISYQWQSSTNGTSFTNISGKTGQSIDADNDLAGKWVRVSVSRANNSGRVYSIAVKVVAGDNDLIGTAEIPNTIKKGEWIDMIEYDEDGETVFHYDLENNEGDMVNYQWQVSDYAIGPWTNIESGGVGYQVDVEEGQYIRVVITTTVSYMDPTPANSGNVKSNACLVLAADPPGPPEITSFEPSIPDIVYRGYNYNIYVTILGNNLNGDEGDLDVEWELAGNTGTDTKIEIETSSSTTTLYIDSGETANELTITVTSVLDSEWTETITITVEDFTTNSITITGLTGISGDISISIFSDLTEDQSQWIFPEIVANGTSNISSGTATFSLTDNFSNAWTDTGDFYIGFTIYLPYNYMTYRYTNGLSYNATTPNSNAKFNISSNNVIDISKFDLLPAGTGVKTLTITGIPTASNGSMLSMQVMTSGFFGYSTGAYGYVKVSGGSAVVSLVAGFDWTPTGSDLIRFAINDGTKWEWYAYTGGADISSATSWSAYYALGHKLDFSATSSVNIDKFVKVDWVN
jgi:hypothetical protein